MIKITSKEASAIARTLLAWYDGEKRPLPWRETSDPYRIWISEIMLQQTQVYTVIPFYKRFLDAFPTVFALADAPLEAVLKAWENMGYYSRARHLHAAARTVVSHFGGRFPDTKEELATLAGIGAYTSGAIRSMAFGHAVPAVDGNVRRVLSRLFGVTEPAERPQTKSLLQEIAAALVPSLRPGDFNQALMDLGATICKSKSPLCAACPIESRCRANVLRLQSVIPLTAKRPEVPHRQAVAAIIRDRRDRILIVQRPEEGLLASFWKFPGGFADASGDMPRNLERLVEEELGMQIRVGRHIVSADHRYTHFRVTLHAYACRRAKGAPRALTCQAWRWATPEALEKLPFSKVDRVVAAAIPNCA